MIFYIDFLRVCEGMEGVLSADSCMSSTPIAVRAREFTVEQPRAIHYNLVLLMLIYPKLDNDDGVNECKFVTLNAGICAPSNIHFNIYSI